MSQNLEIEFISKKLVRRLPKRFEVILSLNDHLYKYRADEQLTAMIENYRTGKHLAIFKKTASLIEGGKGQPEVTLYVKEEEEYLIDVQRSQIELTTITLSREDRELLAELLGNLSANEIRSKGLSNKHVSLSERLYHSL